MLGGLMTALQNPMVQKLGGMALGGFLGKKGYDDAGSAMKMPSEQDVRGAFDPTQGLIKRMTNFGIFSAPGMDLNMQEGNAAVESAMSMGMGGSASNAIKNRIKSGGMRDIYQDYQKGLGSAAQLQGGIDTQVSGIMTGDRRARQGFDAARANQMGSMGLDMFKSSMPNAQQWKDTMDWAQPGIQKADDALGSLWKKGKGLLNWGQVND